MEYGVRDGHGLYGQLTTGDGDGLICHECGAERAFLGRHVREHGLSAAQYRERHGLGRSTPLVDAELAARFAARSRELVGSPSWQRFEVTRDINAARAASLRVTQAGPVRPMVREQRRRTAAAASRSRPRRWCSVQGCGRKHAANGWCRTHYGRWKRTGDVQPHIPVRPRWGGPGAGG